MQPRVRRTMMPEKRTIEKARKAKRAGKAPTTQAGEFVREEIRKIRRGEHGARSPQQAIAIGLSQARRAGVGLRPPGRGKAKERTRRSAAYAYAAGLIVETLAACARDPASSMARRAPAMLTRWLRSSSFATPPPTKEYSSNPSTRSN